MTKMVLVLELLYQQSNARVLSIQYKMLLV
jgi:hypothetical protein